jgi:hypothetical protein
MKRRIGWVVGLVLVMVCSVALAKSPWADNPWIFNELKETDPVRKAVEPIAVKWGDANITSSGLRIEGIGFEVKPEYPDIQQITFTEELLRMKLKEVDGLDFPPDPEGKAYENTIQPFTKEAVKMAAALVADDGFCFSPENIQDRKGLENDLTRALKGLGLRPLDKVTLCQTRVKMDGEWRKVSLIMFYQFRKQRGVFIYLRQGAM